MLAEYCWSFVRETPTGENKRQRKTKSVFNDVFLVRILHIERQCFYLALYIVIKN